MNLKKKIAEDNIWKWIIERKNKGLTEQTRHRISPVNCGRIEKAYTNDYNLQEREKRTELGTGT